MNTIFQHVINLQNSSSQVAVMASSPDAFNVKRGLDKFLRITAAGCWLRENLFHSVSYFCIGEALNCLLQFFKLYAFLQTTNFTHRKMSKTKKVGKDNWRSFREAWTESFGVIEHNGKALGLYIPCTESAGTLLLCISFKTADVNSYVVFSNPKHQLANAG